MSCTHTDHWQSHAPLPVQVSGGALVVTVLWCDSCGHIEYRSPPISLADEKQLQSRMEENNRKQALLNNGPLPHSSVQKVH